MMLQHLKPILVGPELARRVESVKHFEVHHHILISTVIQWQWIQLHVEFNHVVEIWGESYSHLGSLLRLWIIESEGPLLEEFAILVKCVFVYLTELPRSRLVPSRLEYVRTLAVLRLQFLDVSVHGVIASIFITLPQICNIVYLGCQVLFDINTKRL